MLRRRSREGGVVRLSVCHESENGTSRNAAQESVPILAYGAFMGNPRTAAVGLYLLAVIVRVATWRGTSATDRSDDVVLILLIGAVVAAILSVRPRTDTP